MQSNTIFGFLLAAYIIYIVSKNELPKYMGFFVGSKSTAGK